MAWIEDELWEIEQGKPALKIFQLFEDVEQQNPWGGLSYTDVNATISDSKGKQVYQLVVDVDPELGLIKLRLPEAQVNLLKPGSGLYRYDCLLVPPTPVEDGDDNFLVVGPIVVGLRTSRRDP